MFCDAIAKYFSNAIREDGLLARSTAGLVVLEGAAGTVQEIFQAATPLYYAPEGASRPIVLVGTRHWTEHVPVWAGLPRWPAAGACSDALHLVDSVDAASELVLAAARSESRQRAPRNRGASAGRHQHDARGTSRRWCPRPRRRSARWCP